jgi:spore germination cell wall hydrolase CwlJ-like protein
MITATMMCLALNVYHEARSEPMSGQYAVAHVVLNRVQSSRFPDTVCGVVEQGYSKGKHRCQFSWFCDGLSDIPYEQVAWARSLLIADDVMRGEVPDITKGATHYHANYVKPYWAKHLEYNVTYGSHRFYE